ncbi:MAG: NTP transferase domain-containing protein [Planctomycetes bacterium]|nr:NTP transferase domain-containing protein [Planctomycetota bacterium]
MTEHSPPALTPTILLAAGSGERLGEPKAFLKLKDQWMLPKLIGALREGGGGPVIVVVNSEVQQILQDSPCGADSIVVNPDPQTGRTGSLQCGLRALPAGVRGVFIHSVDVPLLSPNAVQSLKTAWLREPEPAQLLARLVTPGGRGGHPLLVGCQYIEELLAFTPDTPLRELASRHPEVCLDFVLRNDPGPFLGVNTPEQRALLESLLSAS